MSATRAAKALMEFDADTRAAIERVMEGNWYEGGAEEARQAVLLGIAGTWTLSIAAHAAGVDEAAVLIALARDHMDYRTWNMARVAVRKVLDMHKGSE
ncbi:hypothetical protein KDX08_30220 [Burkholderia cenocepacia]|uniref:hypothetical protein n=1 Tax=Burkholderia cepacia complex TaxID=87882 RepID=UPI0015941BDE|nr:MULTISPECIES: hypothetical protein [Burkholderia cepacia complex]MBR7996731.1 hypothetical protein [Burkholderia cenocepacia]